ncbi:hypothetical protein C1703_34480 [Streptomyces sp. Go-475]|nr:hypothetical protein C1703_34480 [Streptomyces sp. Go-475]
MVGPSDTTGAQGPRGDTHSGRAQGGIACRPCIHCRPPGGTLPDVVVNSGTDAWWQCRTGRIRTPGAARAWVG